MSRALDKDVLEALKCEDPAAVYKDISTVLTRLPEHGCLLEIELLGKSHPLEPGVHFLQDGNAIAIPKLRLAQAFFVARHIIQKHITATPQSPQSKTVAATTIALVMDPEHLTAANIRKRAVVSRLKTGTEVESILRHEKQFVDSLLTARLHRHTKSPTLWNHRRWLMEQFRSSRLSFDVRQDLATVIMVAAERHPRNYYAWQHARWLIRDAMNGQSAAPLLTVMAEDVKEWCFRHHDDISGWTYLSFVILNIEDREDRRSKCSSVMTETMGMVESLRWTNESVWAFLRTTAARDFVSNDAFDLFQNLSLRLCAGVTEKSTAENILNAAVRWARQRRPDSLRLETESCG
ncbi:hypothetical protein BJ170DRAFT_53871 [Xylariales sp. AK1849]|nr:hypothetical protein BJ170DRAFT_53871 [Xylariales sp. AK1849]